MTDSANGLKKVQIASPTVSATGGLCLLLA